MLIALYVLLALFVLFVATSARRRRVVHTFVAPQGRHRGARRARTLQTA